MGRKKEPRFFDCLECENVTLLSTTSSTRSCPGCGSAHGRVVSAPELERRIEEGGIFSIDLSPGRRHEPSRH
jgi:hypothetical protein